MKKLMPLVVAIVTGLTILLATSVAYACPPWYFYQPKAPKAVLK